MGLAIHVDPGTSSAEDGWRPAVDTMRQQLPEQVGFALFSGSGRDIESLSLGLVAPEPGSVKLPIMVSKPVGEQVVAGAIRLLGVNRFLEGRREGRSECKNPPQRLKK